MSYLREAKMERGFDPCAAFREKLGFIPNLLCAQSLLPRAMEAQEKLEDAIRLRDGAISRVQKERILLAIAADRRDTYCVTVDSKVLSSLGTPDSEIGDFLADYRQAKISAPELAMLEFSLTLSRHAPQVCADDIEALRACGYADEAIIEAVTVTALALYRSTLSIGLGPAPDFMPWEPASARKDAPRGKVRRGTAHDHHEMGRKKGPYVAAPYLSPTGFAPFANVQKSHGFIPNFFRGQTLRPDLLEAELEAMGRILLPAGALTRVQKECILLAASAANLNSYCVAMHSNLLRGMGMTSEDGDQIAVDYRASDLRERDRALLDFAVKLETRWAEFSREDVGALRGHRFTEEQILECEVVTALNNFANTVQMGLGIEPDFEPLAAFEENKVHLLGATETPAEGEGTVHLVYTQQDADAELVVEAQDGKLEAFEELVRRHGELVYRTLTAILGNPADAQDAMQDTLLNAFKHIGSFEGRSKFSTWLVSIARNTALQKLRRGKNFESLDEGEQNEEGDVRPRQIKAWQDNPEQLFSKLEIQRLVERGVLALPATYRVVVMLRDIQQLSTDEVARQMGLSVPTVKTRLLRGRLMLREWLSPHFTASARGMGQ